MSMKKMFLWFVVLTLVPVYCYSETQGEGTEAQMQAIIEQAKMISPEESSEITENGVLGKCRPDYNFEAGLCYPPCEDGYDGVGLVCWKQCDPGYVDDGALCRKNADIFAKKSYGRGVGTIPSCSGSEDYDAGLCYPKCGSGYTGVGPVCWQDCPPGYIDDGAFCRKNAHVYGKETYTRAVDAPVYEGGAKPDNPKYITDNNGRALVLHGVNASSNAKHSAGHMPWISEADVIKETREWGFNTVRFLVFWAAIEPEKGVFDDDYLEEVAKRIKWYTDNGAYVVIDMHQDIYGYAVGGNGAPAWATEAGIFTPAESFPGPWWLRYIDPSVSEAFKNFWEYTNHEYLQDHYIQSWQKVVERFKDDPMVIGYDIMNEPHASDITANFESNWLQKFYERVIAGIREKDNDKWIFFEPRSFGVNFGIPSYLGKVSDVREGEQRLVYAPHEYPLSLHEGDKPYNVFDRRNIIDWSKNRAKELNLHETPFLIGEFGGSDNTPGFQEYLEEITNLFDYMGAGWTYWSNDRGSWGLIDGSGNENPKVKYLVRTYPRAVAGNPVRFSFDVNSADFELEFEHKPGVSGPTEIFVPARHYPNGFDVKVFYPNSGTWSKNWNNWSQILSLTTDATQQNVIVKISRRPEPKKPEPVCHEECRNETVGCDTVRVCETVCN